MRPLTKMARQIITPVSIPAIVRDAFRVAMEERPGPVHLELPEDVAGEEIDDVPLVPPHPIELPVAPSAALDRAAEMICKAQRPLVMLGAGSSRPKLVEPLSNFVRRTRIPFFNTQMGKGSVTGGSNLYMGTAALSSGDYVHRAIDHADLIISIGHDTVEKPPFIMGPDGPKVIHVGFTAASVEQVYFPHEVVGDVSPSLALLADQDRGLRIDPVHGLRSEIAGRIRDRADEGQFPPTPQRIVRDVRRSCRKMGSSASTTECTKSGSRETIEPTWRTRCCSQRTCHDGSGSAVRHDGVDLYRSAEFSPCGMAGSR
jgi:acetolactate synthase-1/2/3 large subunit